MLASALALCVVTAGGLVFRQYESRHRGSAGFAAEAPIGATLESLDAETARSLGLGRSKGVVVTSLADSGAAARGGLQAGDVIERIGKVPIASREEAVAALKGIEMPVEVGLNRHGHHAIVRLPARSRRDNARTDQGEGR